MALLVPSVSHDLVSDTQDLVERLRRSIDGAKKCVAESHRIVEVSRTLIETPIHRVWRRSPRVRP